MEIRKIDSNYNNRTNNIAFKQILRNDIPAKIVKNKKFLVEISGNSGAGKDSVMNEMLDKFNKIVTYTTRPKRKGEVEGKSYFYTTAEKFLEWKYNNEFVESVESFSGNYYGTKRDTIINALDGKKPALLITDVVGAKNVKEYFKNDPEVNVVSIFFRAPSLEVLKQRLLKRGTETLKQINERLDRAKFELEQAKYFDAEIQVNNIQESVNDIMKLLHLN